LAESHPLPRFKACCLDSLGKQLYCLTDSGCVVVDISSGKQSLWQQLDQHAIYLEYLQLSEQLLLVTPDEILTVGESVESQGLVPDGLLAAACSPSQEVLALVTQGGKLLLMNLYFDVTAELDIPKALTAAVSWRPDSKFFVVVLAEAEGVRAFTYSAAGEAVVSSARSDPGEGLVQLVSEKPNLLSSPIVALQASLVAGVYQQTIRFWEKIGLLHGHLECQVPIKGLTWSPDGEILCVQADSVVKLYVRSNYNWYLKQSIDAPGLVSVLWQSSSQLVLAGSSLSVLELKWSYDVSADFAVVVDGSTLKVTEFSKAVIPPPMCAYEVPLEAVPMALHCGQTHKVLIVNNQLLELTSRIARPVAQLQYTGRPTNLVLVQDTAYFTADLLLWEVSLINGSSCSTALEAPCIGLAPSQAQGVWVQDKQGLCRHTARQVQLPSACVYFAAVQLEEDEQIVGLLRNSSKLYCGRRLLSPNCSNFAVFTGVLAFVESSSSPLNTLAVLQPAILSRLLERDPVKLPEPSSEQFVTRHVERGSRLVTSWSTSLVLQLPRGNLELISPRVFVLDAIKANVLAGHYGAAFALLKKHRVDFNLLYDLAPQLFFERLSAFLEQIREVEALNLFLAALKDEDFEAVYFGTAAKSSAGKTDSVCEAIRGALSPSTHLLSVVTTYAKQTKYTEALMAITAYADSVSKEAALKYLCWLGNPDALYEVALASFDLELTLKVAQHTQKDPKEFLPYLQKLKALEPVAMKVQILTDLKQFSKALEILSRGGEEAVEAALELTKKYNLHVQALELYRGSAQWPQFARNFAQYLSAKGLNSQAGAMYRAAGDLASAREAYRQSRDWRLYLAVAEQEGLRPSDLASEEASLLAEQGDFEGCADLLKLVEVDRETLVTSLLRIHAYLEAVAASLGRPHLESLVTSSVLTQSAAVLEDIHASLHTWRDKLARLLLVQRNKRAMPQSQLTANDEAASEYSVDSRTSKATQLGKRKRKTAKKLRKTAAKEGSQFEEEYLVDLLKTVKPDRGFQDRIDSVSKALVQVGEVGRAGELLSAYEELTRETAKVPYTLRQTEFITSFYSTFADVPDDATSVVAELALRSYFLAPEKREWPGVLGLAQYQAVTKLG
jgi:elongator complex protein 1